MIFMECNSLSRCLSSEMNIYRMKQNLIECIQSNYSDSYIE